MMTTLALPTLPSPRPVRPIKVRSAAAVAAARPAGLPKESLTHRGEEKVADAIDFAGSWGFICNVGVKIYGRFSQEKPNQAPLANTGTLTPSLMRGAQPTPAGFQALAAQGVNTVINLRVEQNTEGPDVTAAGMRYLYMPEPAVGPPTIAQGLAFLSAVTDPANGKVYFHCQHGADRTGAMAAIYRLTMQDMPVDRAVSEMYEYSFHEGFEDEKLVFVRQFAKYWAGLAADRKAEILHKLPTASPAGN